MNGKDFAEMIKGGIHPVVVFNKDIEELETYAENGMRARVVSAILKHDDVVMLRVDYSEFDEFNKQFETASYFNKDDGNPTLTAREAGYYIPQDSLYIDSNSEVPFVVEDAARLKLYDQYLKDDKKSAFGYTQWLEDRLNAAQLLADENAAHAVALQKAMKNVLPFVVTQVVACNGLKCREVVCESCFTDAPAAVERACNAYGECNKALAGLPTGFLATFQDNVKPWLLECFGEEIANNKTERNHRYLEESLELVQSTGCTQEEAYQLVDYVFNRPVGEPTQEVGGAMVTLAALCLAHKMDMHDAGNVELARIWTKMEQIRAKQASKPRRGPLPGR